MRRIKKVFIFAMITGSIFMKENRVLAAEEIVELREGEELMLPDHGTIRIKDETVVSPGENGNLEAREEGETEIVVSYKIRVKKPGEEKSREEESTTKEVPAEKIQEETMQAEEVSSEESSTQESLSEENLPEESSPENMQIKENSNEETPKEKLLRDVTPPEILMPDLEKVSANKEAVTPVILIKDENCDKNKINISILGSKTEKRELNFEKEVKGKEIRITAETITLDGDYLLICKAEDLAGNKTEEWWSFSVNQAGTGFVCTREKEVPRIALENVDAVEIVSCSLNGVPVTYQWKEGKLEVSEKELKEGKNRIRVTVKDAAGNISEMDPWDFTLPVEQKEETVEEKTDKKEETTIKMQKETPLGIIFLLIGSILVFWEKKVCYNGNRKKI